MYLPKPTEGGDFQPCPAGSFIATCYRFVDLGTHTTEFNGDKKTRHEVMISWELADEMMSDGRPFTINKRYTWSMHEKATLRQHLEAWRKKPFTDDDFEGPNAFDIKNVVGKPCTLMVSQIQKNGKTYSSVSGVGPMLKSASAPPLRNKQAYLDLTPEGWSPETYGELSDYFKQLIGESPEYKELMKGNRRADDPAAAPAQSFEDDIPF